MNMLLKLMAILSIITAFRCGAAEKWIITKADGAYRVNGFSLMATGRLSDANGITAKVLTKDELREIGEAIDNFDAGHSSPYAHSAIAGPSKPSDSVVDEPKSSPPYQPAPPQVERRSRDEDSLPAAGPKTSSGGPDPVAVLISIPIVLLFAYYIYYSWLREAHPIKCPRCGDRLSVRRDGVMVLGSEDRLENQQLMKTDVHRDYWGNRIGTTERTESIPVVVNRSLYELKYTCRKCAKKWSEKTWL